MLYNYLGEARLAIADKREAAGQSNPLDPINQSYRREALDAYLQAVKLAPDDSTLLMREGEILARLGRLDEAEPVFEHLLAVDPNSGVVLTYQGFYLQHAGRLEEAEATYRRALSLDSIQAAQTGLEQVIRERAAQAGTTK